MAENKIRTLFVATAELENDKREVIGTYCKGEVVDLPEASFNFWAAQGKCKLAPEGAKVGKPKTEKPAEDQQEEPAATTDDTSKGTEDEGAETVTEGEGDDEASNNAKPGTGSRSAGSKTNNRRRS